MPKIKQLKNKKQEKCPYCSGNRNLMYVNYPGKVTAIIEIESDCLNLNAFCDDDTYNIYDEKTLINYCPMCGRKLKEHSAK